MNKTIIRPSVIPIGMATPYFATDGPYRMVIRKGRGKGAEPWAYIYYGRRRVWDCNPVFAKHHFADFKPTKVKKL